MRDHSLDLLKGVACVMMLFAHTAVQVDTLSKGLTFIGSFAPVLFFAVSGITAHFQSKRYAFNGMLITYALIFTLGLSYNGMISENFLDHFHMDILQIIAVGILLVYIIERYFSVGPTGYLGIAITVFMAKLLTDTMRGESEIMDSLSIIFVEPGLFVIVPWVFPFFVGMFSYFTNNRNNLIVAMISVFAIITLKLAGFSLELDNRWDMSAGNFFFSIIIICLSFYIARLMSQAWMVRHCSGILYLGVNSLLFLYIHIFVIIILRALYPDIMESYTVWVAVGITTLLFMYLVPIVFNALQMNRVMNSINSWIFLLLLVVVIPAIFHEKYIIVSVEFALGLILSVYYPLMTKAIKLRFNK